MFNYTVRLLPKCHALQCLYRMRYLNTAKKQYGNAAEFLGSILRHISLFLML